MENNTGIHILVVEDESSVRDVITQVLEEENHTVTSVESAEEALDVLSRETIQLVISDIRLGGMDGIKLLEKIKAKTPEIEVVMMTSNASLDTSIKAIREGAFDYLLKPFDELEVIPAMVNRIVEKIRKEEKRQQTIESLKTLSEEVLNRLHVGVVLVDGEGTLVLSNKNAQAFFSSGSGLIVENRKLTTPMPKTRKELKDLINHVSQQNAELSKRTGVMRISREKPFFPLTLLVSPIGNKVVDMEIDNVRATAIIFITEESRKIQLSQEVLNILYDLTPAEARLTVALVDGLELEEIAKKLNVSVHTLRGHLKRVFKKTGVHRQSDLINLVLSGPAKYSSHDAS